MLDRLVALPAYLNTTPLFAVTLSLMAFGIASFIAKKLNNPIWLPPLVTSMFLVAIVLYLMNMDYDIYKKQAYIIEFFLAPATVALAIPLYQQFYNIRKLLVPILTTLVLAGSFASISVLVLAKLLHLDVVLASSLAAKSVTAPIAVGIAYSLNAIPALTISVVLLTGLIASLITPRIAKLLKITDTRVVGFTMGLNGHAFATSRAFEIDLSMGAFSSLAMATNGIFTALFLPMAKDLIYYFFS